MSRSSPDGLPHLLQRWIDTERTLREKGIHLGRFTAVQCYVVYVASVVISTVENIIYILGRVGSISYFAELSVFSQTGR